MSAPATCIAHWSSGPVPCCDHHAEGLVKLGRFMGLHVPLTALQEPAQCANCVNVGAPNTKETGHGV